MQRRSEQFHHETRPSDGEVYRKVMHYKEQGLAQDWKNRLTDYKQYALNLLLERRDLVEALRPLLDIPVLLCDLTLGNTERHVRSPFKPEIICFWRHVHTTWNKVTCGNPFIQKNVTIQDVRDLEGRAPSVSETDRQFIVGGMDGRSLFTAITDGDLRKSIKQALLRVETIIPTLKTFHENFKQLEIAAKILKTHLLDGVIETTLYDTLLSYRSPQEDFWIEHREGEFQRINLLDRDLEARLTYIQLLISILRNYPFLSKCSPRIDPRQKGIEAKVDPAYRFQLLKSARLQGYRTKKVLRGLENAAEQTIAPNSEPCLPLAVYGESLKRRYGRPFTSAFQHFRTRLFLPNLCQAQAEVSLMPSVMFVQRDFIEAFFGPIPKIPGIQTSLEPPNLSVQLMAPDCKTTEAEVQLPLNGSRDGTAISEGSSTASPLLPTLDLDGQLGWTETEEVGICESKRISETGSEGEAPGSPKCTLSRHAEEFKTRHLGPPREMVGSPESLDSSETFSSALVSAASSEFLDPMSRSVLSPAMDELSNSFMSVALPPNTVSKCDESLATQSQEICTLTVFETLLGDEERRKALTSELHHDGEDHLDSSAESCLSLTSSDISLLEHDCPEIPTPDACPKIDSIESRRSSFRRSSSLRQDSFDNIPTPSQKDQAESCRSFLFPDMLESPEKQSSIISYDDSSRSFLESGLFFSHRRDTLDGNRPEDETESCRSFLDSPWANLSLRDILPKRHSLTSEVSSREAGRSFLEPLTPALQRYIDRTRLTSPLISHEYKFIEYNGVLQLEKSTNDMEKYLQNRPGWIMMANENQVAKTVRFEHVTWRMNNRTAGETFALIAPTYLEQFLQNHNRPKRAVETDDNGSELPNGDSNKRMKLKGQIPTKIRSSLFRTYSRPS